MSERSYSLATPDQTRVLEGHGVSPAPGGTPVLGASASASLHAPESAAANQDLLESFGERSAAKSPWVADPVAFREVPPTRLQVDPIRFLRVAALAAAMALPAAATPRHNPPTTAHQQALHHVSVSSPKAQSPSDKPKFDPAKFDVDLSVFTFVLPLGMDLPQEPPKAHAKFDPAKFDVDLSVFTFVLPLGMDLPQAEPPKHQEKP